MVLEQTVLGTAISCLSADMCDDLSCLIWFWRIVLDTCRQLGRWLWFSLLLESNNHIYHFSCFHISMLKVFATIISGGVQLCDISYLDVFWNCM